MKRLTFDLLGMVESANALNKMNKYAVAAHRSTWKNDTYLVAGNEARRQNWQTPAFAHVHVTFRFPDKARRDSDNYIAGLKGVLDGMVRAGVLQDDDFLHMDLRVSAVFGQRASMFVEVTAE